MSANRLLVNLSIGAAIAAAIGLGLVFWFWLFGKFNEPAITPVANVYGALERGKWGWDLGESPVSCEQNPHVIRFREHRTEAVIEFDKKIHSPDGAPTNSVLYKILDRSGNRITMRIVGEKRLDDKGQPVVWDLVLLNEEEYAWHRLDWPRGALTPHIVLCR